MPLEERAVNTKLRSSYCGPPNSPSPVSVSSIWDDLEWEVFTSICVEPSKEVPCKNQDTSRKRRSKPRGNRSTIVPDADDECPRLEEKGMNLMLPTGTALLLEDSPTLSRWSLEGCEVDCGAPCLEEALTAAVDRGPHKGALSEEAMQLVHDDVEYQVKAGFAEIYFWDDLKGDPPSNLKFYPVIIIPQPD